MSCLRSEFDKLVIGEMLGSRRTEVVDIENGMHGIANITSSGGLTVKYFDDSGLDAYCVVMKDEFDKTHKIIRMDFGEE